LPQKQKGTPLLKLTKLLLVKQAFFSKRLSVELEATLKILLLIAGPEEEVAIISSDTLDNLEANKSYVV